MSAEDLVDRAAAVAFWSGLVCFAAGVIAAVTIPFGADEIGQVALLFLWGSSVIGAVGTVVGFVAGRGVR